MNGRVYDPQLGRFLSADPTMQFPYSSQGYNRYNYVGNNPLKYVDPSGYGWNPFTVVKRIVSGRRKAVKKVLSNPIVRTMVVIAAAVVTGGAAASAMASSLGYASATAATIGASATMTSAMLVGAAAGAAGSFAATLVATNGNLKASFKAAITGGIMGGMFGGISYGFTQNAWFDSNHLRFDHNSYPILTAGQRIGKVMAQSFTAGVGAKVQGESFEDAFKTGAIMYALGETANYMRSRTIMSSMRNPNNAGKHSGGWYGDGFGAAGGRQEVRNGMLVDMNQINPSTMGGVQGLEGEIFGIPYEANGFWDHITEAWSGPHDFLNSWTYNNQGNFEVVDSLNVIANVGNYVNVLPATVFAYGATVQTYSPSFVYR